MINFNEETGAFEFPSTFAWAMVGLDTNGNLLGYYWAATAFNVTVSTGDYSIGASIENECTPDNKFKLTVNPGPDAASIKAIVLPYDVDASKMASSITSVGSEIKAGTYTIDPVNQHFLFSQEGAITESTVACVILASYDAEGNIQKTQTVSMIVVMENDEGWNDVATITYEDQLFSQYYNNFSHSQEAMLQEKEGTPGLYRIVNPYSAYSKIHSDNCPHYFIIDTTDPEWVSIPLSVSGVDLGDGVLVFGSCAALGYDKETAQTKNMIAGTLSGQTVTFPARSIFCHESKYNAPGSWSYMTTARNVEITFPDITLDFIVVNQDEAPVEGISVKCGENVYTTDAEGKAAVAVPFETGYFGNININVANGDDKEDVEVALKGAANTYTHKITTAGVDNVIADNDTAVEYFNLQGIRVEKPANGLFIKKQGSKATKVLVK